MNNYQIWAEGYAATGEHGLATFVGISEGDSFEEACNNFAEENEDWAKDYDIMDHIPAHWGCRLFPNESEARVAFG